MDDFFNAAGDFADAGFAVFEADNRTVVGQLGHHAVNEGADKVAVEVAIVSVAFEFATIQVEVARKVDVLDPVVFDPLSLVGDCIEHLEQFLLAVVTMIRRAVAFDVFGPRQVHGDSLPGKRMSWCRGVLQVRRL